MKIKLLQLEYKTQEFYQYFLENKLWDSNYISEDYVWIPCEIPSFPIFLSTRDTEKKEKEFILAINIISENVIVMDRDIFMSERFWHSWLCLYQREYLIETYPQIKEGYEKFKSIVIKEFNWENYIYKAILIAQYVKENKKVEEREHMYHLILQNMDMFNYIIKYDIFRNGIFLINIMDIIEETKTSKILKSKIKNRSDLGNDERYGRRVIYEFNKSYPIILSPMLEKEQLKEYFLKYLSYYYHEDDELDADDSDIN